MRETFVPADFDPPTTLSHRDFLLEPLGVEHNERDHEAWMSSLEQIRGTPGFPWEGWPAPMSLEQNEQDLRDHAADFEARRGFTYTVLSPSDRDVIGCVYIYPDPEGVADASVRSWVRATHANLDVPLWRSVSAWLEKDWPFAGVAYASRRE